MGENNFNKLSWNEYNGKFKADIFHRKGAKISSGDLFIQTFFDNIEANLIDKINQYQEGAIFGCVAWLTNEKILRALAKVKNVQIIVQKEDFLRPDCVEQSKVHLKKLYGKLSNNVSRNFMKYGVDDLSWGLDPNVESLRCLGNFNSVKNPSMPRCHHKFLVFCRTAISQTHANQPDCDIEYIDYTPEAIWTGSFNFSHNAVNSLENVIYLSDKSGTNPIIEEYLKEHHFALGLSEPLNWETAWVEPEYRIGS